MRDCHPGPVALNFFNTSSSGRMDTAGFLEPAGGPGRRKVAACWGGSSLAGRARAKSSCVHSGFSSSNTKGLFGITAHLLGMGPAQADHPNLAAAIRRGEAMRHIVDEAIDTVARLLETIVLDENERNEIGGSRQRDRSEEHTSEIQSLMRKSNAVCCLKKKTKDINYTET